MTDNTARPGEWVHIGFVEDFQFPGFEGRRAEVFAHRYTDSLGLDIKEPATNPFELSSDKIQDEVRAHYTNPKNGFSVSESTVRGKLLNEAKDLIEGDRNKTYGSPTQNFQNTAELFTTLLRHKLKDGETIHPYEIATLMIALKLARTIAEPKRDNFVDIAGYAACGYETLEELGS